MPVRDLNERRRLIGGAIILAIAALFGVLLLMSVAMWFAGGFPPGSSRVWLVWLIEVLVIGGLVVLGRRIQAGGRSATLIGTGTLLAVGLGAPAFAVWHVSTVEEGHGGGYVVLGALFWFAVTVPVAILLWRARPR